MHLRFYPSIPNVLPSIPYVLPCNNSVKLSFFRAFREIQLQMIPLIIWLARVLNDLEVERVRVI